MAWLMQEALCNNALVSIYDVPSGLECNCVCPYCGAKLIAKKGNIKEHHFAHHNAEDCGKGQETLIHRMAKEIISKRKYFPISMIELKFKSCCKNPWLISERKNIDIDYIEIEKRFDNFIADIYLESKGHGLLVEIKVTHQVNKIKLEKIKKKNISCIEINLSKYKDSKIIEDKELLEKILEYELYENMNNQEWLYNTIVERIRKDVLDLTEKRKYRYVSQNRRYITDCPLRKNIKRETDYKNQLRFCFSCEYSYGGMYENNPKCLGHLKIKTYDDYKILLK